jgi:hypothetical protein
LESGARWRAGLPGLIGEGPRAEGKESAEKRVGDDDH